MWNLQSSTGQGIMGMKWLGAFAMLLTALPLAALAGPRDDVLQALARCADIADRDARIACFDRQTPQLRAAIAEPPAAPPASAPMAPAAPAAEPPPPSGSPATTIFSS